MDRKQLQQRAARQGAARDWIGALGFLTLVGGCAWAWPPAGAIATGAVLLAAAVWGTIGAQKRKDRDE
jgi:hypothetical protein